MQHLKLTVYSSGATLLLLSPEHPATQLSATKVKMTVQWSREMTSRRGMGHARAFQRSVYDDDMLASPVLR